ncbi:MAG: glycosyltransferase family 4 protein [Chloroflexota bacterium]
MQVALNAHHLSFGTSYRGAGISRYIRNLLPALRKVDGPRYLVHLGDRNVPPDFAPDERFSLRFSRLPTRRPVVRILWEQFWLPLALRGDGADVLHSLGYVQPLACPSRTVLTVHDLSFLLYPGNFNAANRLYLSNFTRLSAKRADRIVAVSENTKRDVVRLLGVPAEKVAVVYHGIEPHFRVADPAEVSAFRARHGLPERFILFLGTIEPRKNLDTLVEAFGRLKRSGLPHGLVLAGAKGWQWGPVFAAVERLGLARDVFFPGYVPYDEQPLWYNASELFVYPSLYEGFGFPPLEAMACGAPVIASGTSALPEVVGDAGLLVDPRNVDSLAEAMHHVLNDADQRERMRALGVARARAFTWEEAARQTAAVYYAAGARNER